MQGRVFQRSLGTRFAELKRLVGKIDAREAEASAPQDQVQSIERRPTVHQRLQRPPTVE